MQRYRGKREHMAWSGEMKVVEPGEVGKSKRANEGERNCWSSTPKEQKEAFSRALGRKTSHSL